MEHHIRPLSPNSRTNFLARAKAAQDLAQLALGEIDEALYERQIDTTGSDAADALLAQEEARMSEYWRDRTPTPPLDFGTPTGSEPTSLNQPPPYDAA